MLHNIKKISIYFPALLVSPSRFCHNKQSEETLSKWKLTYPPVSFDIQLLSHFLAALFRNSVHMLQGWPASDFWAICNWWMVQVSLPGWGCVMCLVTALLCHSDSWANSWREWVSETDIAGLPGSHLYIQPSSTAQMSLLYQYQFKVFFSCDFCIKVHLLPE